MTLRPDTSATPVAPTTARAVWRVLEPYHAVVYFAPEARAAYAEAGLRGQWMGYFASRAAAMGQVGSETVVATFHNFHPRMVRRAIPDAWSFSTVDRVLEARRSVADAALRRLCGDSLEDTTVAEAAALAQRAAQAIDPAGRPLGAAHAAQPVPDEPHLALWHAAATLREHRFDGHVAVLVGYGVDGCEALVSSVAAGAVPRELLQPMRGWSDEEWEAACERLRRRGFLDAAGSFTDDGRRLRETLEHRTDVCATQPFTALGEDGCARLVALMRPVIDGLIAARGLPALSPLPREVTAQR